MVKDIRYVLNGYSERVVNSWVWLKPKVYYKFGKPYGLLATREIKGVIYLVSCTKDDSVFTFGMIKDMILMNRNSNVCVVFKANGNKTKQIASVLSKYGGTFEQKNKHMYWYNRSDDV